MTNKIEKIQIFRATIAKVSFLSSSQLLLVTVCIALFFARIVFHFQTANILIERLRQPDESTNSQTKAEDDYALHLSKVMSMAASKLPWRTDCLIQCLAVKWILRRKGISSVFFLGVNHRSEKEFTAHAWLKIGNITIPQDRHSHMKILTKTLPRQVSR